MDDERWKELCRLIMTEQDPQKLWNLVYELNQEFEKREKDLGSQKKSENDPAAVDPASGLADESS